MGKINNTGTLNFFVKNTCKLLSRIEGKQKMLFGLSCDSLRELAHDVANENNIKVSLNDNTVKASKDWL